MDRMTGLAGWAGVHLGRPLVGNDGGLGISRQRADIAPVDAQGELASGEVVADVADVERRIGPWRGMTVVPLRQVRRALRSPPALVEPSTAEAFRTKIKAVELEAERLQQEAMYQMAQSSTLGRPASSLQDAARDSVAAYETSCAKPFPKPAVETLLGVFARLDHKPEE